jgi:F-type H+-transporting ATPase subunit b
MSDIGIDWHVLLAQLINFGLLFGLLFIVAYKPLRRMLDQRSARIKESMEQTERIKEQLAQTQEQVKAQMMDARREGQAILAQAAQMGERLKEEARQEAKQEAEAIVVRARAEIEHERDAAIAQLRNQFVDLAIAAAEKVVSEILDREKHRRLIEEVLEQAQGGEN